MTARQFSAFCRWSTAIGLAALAAVMLALLIAGAS